MIKVLLNNQKQFRAEAQYVFETFFDVIGATISFVNSIEDIENNDILICYGKPPQKMNFSIIIPDCDWQLWEKDIPKMKFIDATPVIFVEKFDDTKLLRVNDSGISCIFSFDIIAASFFLLSRQEERINKKRDVWGCFSEEFSLTHQWKITQIPTISIYIDTFLNAIIKISRRQGKHVTFLPRWKNHKKFAVALTHDVDNLKKYSLFRNMKALLKGLIGKDNSVSKGIKLLLQSMFTQTHSDPYWSFDDFMKLESEFGFKSSFYFISCPSNHRYDVFYNLNRDLRKQIRVLEQEGWEIGLHGSFDSFDNSNMLMKEKRMLEQALGRSTLGVRQHYLRFCVEKTLLAQEEAGFIYDTTLGYNEHIGFRSGIATPFFPFDVQRRKKYNLLELPLAVMDGSLFEFQHLSPNEALCQVKKIINRVESVGGLLVILWHTKAKDEHDCPGWWQVYRQILEYLYTKNAWVTNAAEICTWWLSRLKKICVE
jgi:peptidoglycan/xylan/chitin deacetylase (PgdA/CDA1 family)